MFINGKGPDSDEGETLPGTAGSQIMTTLLPDNTNIRKIHHIKSYRSKDSNAGPSHY